MRPSAIFLPLLALLALAGPAQAKARPHRAAAATCAARGSTTVALDPQARVYVRSQRGDADQHELIGCLLASGRSVRLNGWFDCGCSRGDESGPQLWLRGTVVAINRFSCPPDPLLGGCVGGARTFDLRTRRTLREASTGTAISALAIGPRGAFAYVSSGGAVVKSDASGEDVVLDPGPGIDLGSLAVGGAWVYWVRDGAPHGAQLTP
jgi:hypothetical protein